MSKIIKKKNLEVGKEYYTYFFANYKDTNSPQEYTGILKVEVVSKEPSTYSENNYYVRFNIIKGKKLSPTLSHNNHLYMDGYGLGQCYFFDNENDCIIHHNEALKDYVIGKKVSVRDNFLAKLINDDGNIKKDKIEIDSMNWYNSLTTKEKNYIKWIKNFGDIQ